ncbi:MAG: ABC transporter ATP-binding protein [unclassified Hahellaceae]|nr:ABC transporter ATP-binding protein [Hahellaceae bacterium]|tara:strand:- start:56323 stop:57480 length:1158 start_codon:yes stop_codon:yes gene_type:complete
MLELHSVCKTVDRVDHIRDVSMSLERGSLNVLLGPTLAGKTSLMRLMAGLDRPTSGDIRMDGKSVLGVPVQKRKVAMVYQQFINYPSLSVFDNIASPLRIAGVDAKEISRRVEQAAELLQLKPMLNRKPEELSGGQQQRTALARALVKDADLVLLDEPLANLDFKLREELRVELPRMFAASGAVFVYATTEPMEALLLGGNTATLSKGRLTQFGPTLDVYNRPADLITAQTFSEPPLNVLDAVIHGSTVSVGEREASLSNLAERLVSGTLQDGNYRLGIRPHHAAFETPGQGNEPDILRLPVVIKTFEITGSESFVHCEYRGQHLVALLHGIVHVVPGAEMVLRIPTGKLLIFSLDGALVAAGLESRQHSMQPSVQPSIQPSSRD